MLMYNWKGEGVKLPYRWKMRGTQKDRDIEEGRGRGGDRKKKGREGGREEGRLRERERKGERKRKKKEKNC